MGAQRRVRRRGDVGRQARCPSRRWLALGPGVLLTTVVLVLALLGGATGTSQEGDTAPDFTPGAAAGSRVALPQLLPEHEAVVLLSDPGAEVTRRYGVYNLLGDGVAAPSTLIVGEDGAIRWRHVGRDIADRQSAEEILRRLSGSQG